MVSTYATPGPGIYSAGLLHGPIVRHHAHIGVGPPTTLSADITYPYFAMYAIWQVGRS